MSGQKKRSGAVAFLFENSIFLIGGALIALIWANTAPDSYHRFIEYDFGSLLAEHAEADDPPTGEAAPDPETEAVNENDQAAPDEHHGHKWDLHHIVNDLLMALFFAIAGSEVWEALLPGGALSNRRKAATPLMATLGGIVGPAGIYLLGAFALGESGLNRGWAIPCATDIAFSYLVARLIFGQGHPAIAFLLLLAIADDAAGLVILAVAYPSGPLHPEWFLAVLLAMGIGFRMRKAGLHSFWWYLLIPGSLSWFAFLQSGVHPALGLVPVIVTMPHAHTDLGIFAREEMNRDDTLNSFVKWWADPVELILGLFGLVNAGVAFSSAGAGTWLVLSGLLIGKPVGILLFTWLSQRVLRLEIPGGMNYRDVVTLGMIAGIGFTVALFVSTAAFNQPGDPHLDAAKMGALASFLAAVLSFGLARMLGVRKFNPSEDSPTESVPEPVMSESAEFTTT